MAIKKALFAGLGAAVVFCQVSAGEALAYNCGKNLASLASSTAQRGPLFAVGDLIFTSVEASDLSRLLLVNSGAGNFVLRLKGGLNRIRFQIPGMSGRPGHMYFLSYIHGDGAPSRFFEVGEDRAPIGHEVTDYQLISAARAEYLEPYLVYAIQKTALNMASALSEGRLSRSVLHIQPLPACQALVRRTPSLVKSLKVIEGPSRQMSAQRPFKRAKTTNSLALRVSIE